MATFVRPALPYPINERRRLIARCHRSGKVRWLTEDAARQALDNLTAGGRAYRCPDCGYWHITRAEPRT